MATVAQTGLARARELYEKRGLRARELAEQGKKVVGYFCCYTPVEILTALDLVPYRIQGGVGRPLRDADQYLEVIMCPYVRSCFDLAIGGEYDFLSGVIIPHTCDAMHRIYDTWKYFLKPRYSRSVTVPHMTHEASFDYFEKELEDLKESLAQFAGRKVTDQELSSAIGLHNRNRELLRSLYAVRKLDPPLVSGVEATSALIAGMTIPAVEFAGMLEETVSEVRMRVRPPGKKPRLMVVGNEIDDLALVHLAEECGASVVMDDTCTGSRTFWKDVDPAKPPVRGLAEAYLGGITCPVTYRPGKARERFGYLEDQVRNWKVQGVLIYEIRYCDTYQIDAPEIKEYLEERGIPVLILEDDYIAPPTAQWKTRIEAFLETIEFKKEST